MTFNTKFELGQLVWFKKSFCSQKRCEKCDSLVNGDELTEVECSRIIGIDIYIDNTSCGPHIWYRLDEYEGRVYEEDDLLFTMPSQAERCEGALP